MTSPVRIIVGDCLEAMRGMDAESVDAIVTDPPYGLSFMGKHWDHGVPGVDFWIEALRVAKPGTHLLAFGGTRTYHRLACAIEDAGWEVRDCIAWVYGSGFPKSLDVSKAIDGMDAADEQHRRRLRFTAWVRSTCATAKQIDAATGTNMGGHYTATCSQPAIMTREHLEACRHLFRDVPPWVESECDIRTIESKNLAEREVVAKQRGTYLAVAPGQDNDRGATVLDITAPATEAAKRWSGWGTALKPAFEPIIVARKPLIGTVAENVTAHGTGAMNVGGCRVGTEEVTINTWNDGAKPFGGGAGHEYTGRTVRGRWPANLIHDGSAEVVAAFPQAKGQQGAVGPQYGDKASVNAYGDFGPRQDFQPRGDTGSAARFFYCAKASKADRGEGNAHPTVKPTALMRYLCRLVTPPGGIVLDPFAGSGSTGKGAVLEGFNFIGIELDAEYAEIARARIGNATSADKGLFA